MAGSARMKERAAGGRRGEFLFVVHVVAPTAASDTALMP